MPSSYAVEVKGSSSAQCKLNFGNITLDLKLYKSIDEPTSELHKGCPTCLGPVKSPNVCQTVSCADYDLRVEKTLRVHVGSGEPIHLPEEELKALLLPDGSALTNKEELIIHARLSEKQAYSMLSRSTLKYYLVPDSASAASIYAVLLHTMLATKQALMVKFCLKSQKQNLGLIVEDEGQLVLCMLPFAHEFRAQPKFHLPTQMSETIVHSVTDGFLEFPEFSINKYEDAKNDYQIAFDYFLENKIKAAAIKRGTPVKEKKNETMVELVLERAKVPAAKVTRAERPARTVEKGRPARKLSMKSKNEVKT